VDWSATDFPQQEVARPVRPQQDSMNPLEGSGARAGSGEPLQVTRRRATTRNQARPAC